MEVKFILLYFLTVSQGCFWTLCWLSSVGVLVCFLLWNGQWMFHCVAQAELGLLSSSNPPASTSQVLTLVENCILWTTGGWAFFMDQSVLNVSRVLEPLWGLGIQHKQLVQISVEFAHILKEQSQPEQVCSEKPQGLWPHLHRHENPLITPAHLHL